MFPVRELLPSESLLGITQHGVKARNVELSSGRPRGYDRRNRASVAVPSFRSPARVSTIARLSKSPCLRNSSRARAYCHRGCVAAAFRLGFKGDEVREMMFDAFGHRDT
jgi:hypothetical protein